MINLFGAVCMLTSPRVNFINILRAAFARTDPKSTKKTYSLTIFFLLLGSVRVKTACRTLMKLTPSVRLKWRKAGQTNCRKLNLKNTPFKALKCNSVEVYLGFKLLMLS